MSSFGVTPIGLSVNQPPVSIANAPPQAGISNSNVGRVSHDSQSMDNDVIAPLLVGGLGLGLLGGAIYASRTHRRNTAVAPPYVPEVTNEYVRKSPSNAQTKVKHSAKQTKEQQNSSLTNNMPVEYLKHLSTSAKELEQAQQQLADANAQIKNEKQTHAAGLQARQDLENKLKEATKARDDVETQNQTLLADLEQERQRLADLEQECQRLTTANQAHGVEHQKLTEDAELAQKQFAEASARYKKDTAAGQRDLQELRIQLEEATKARDEVETQNHTLQTNVVDLEKELQLLATANQAHGVEHQKLTENAELAQKQFADASARYDRANAAGLRVRQDLQTRLEQTNQAHQDIETRNQTLMSDIEKLNANNAKLEEELQRLDAVNQNHEAEHQTLREELSRAQGELTSQRQIFQTNALALTERLELMGKENKALQKENLHVKEDLKSMDEVVLLAHQHYPQYFK